MCGSLLHIHQYLKTHGGGVKVRRSVLIRAEFLQSLPPTLACTSIGAEGVARGWAGAVKTPRGVGAAVGAHVTSGRQSALINV